MFLRQGSGSGQDSGDGFALKARLTSAVTYQLEISVTHNTSNLVTNAFNYAQSDCVISTNNTSTVTLLSLPIANVVNSVEAIKIYNPNTQASTVIFLADDTPICNCTVGPGETVILSESGLKNISSEAGAQDLSGLVPKTTTINSHALNANINITKSDVGLSNVDNTSDVNKPISTATQVALNTKADSALGARHYVGNAGEPQFQNGWVNYNNNNEPALFYKDNFGIVHLEGIIKSGAVNNVAFTLPTEYIPLGDKSFIAISGNTSGYLYITAGGAVIPAIGSNASFSLECISFRASDS